mmetsp:Transcript_13854/g.29562  ORF Transcript_13854/g.29562 Transcript_13854/m.29562 type:complete len:316 (-) Transcript_13854:669-1616(-)
MGGAVCARLDDALGEHGLRHLGEASDVGAEDVVAGLAVLDGGVVGVAVDLDHDGVQLGVHLLAGPGAANGVLRHLQPGAGHPARVRRLAETVGQPRVLVHLDRLGGAGHVGALRHRHGAVGHDMPGVPFVHLVLGGAREVQVGLHLPQGVVVQAPVKGGEIGGGVLGGVLADAAAAHVLELQQEGVLLGGDAVGVVDEAAGVGDGHHLGAELVQLLDGVLGHVARARHHRHLAGDALVPGLQHLLAEVHRAVAGGLRADEGAAPLEALAGENAGELVARATSCTSQTCTRSRDRPHRCRPRARRSWGRCGATAPP